MRLLKKDGWYAIRQSGSHMIMVHPVKRGQIVCPSHGSQEVGKGLEKKSKKTQVLNKNSVMKIEIIVEKTKTGYSAFSAKYPVYSIGRSLPDLQKGILEALNLYFRKQNKTITEKDLKITLDLPQFFTFYKVINAKALAERIGINQSLLAQYISGHKKPSVVQTNRILKGIQQVGKELAGIQFLT